MKLGVAASSQTPIGIGSAGTHDMVLCPSRVLLRRDHKGCFSTCGRSAQPFRAEGIQATFPRGDLTLQPLTLFVWSKSRVVPVRVFDFSVTEEAFDPNLNPIRAKISLGLRVLNVDDLGFSHPGGPPKQWRPYPKLPRPRRPPSPQSRRSNWQPSSGLRPYPASSTA